MIGKFGETFVLDWGEALVVNPETLATEGPVPAASEVEEQTDSPAGGTVPYMPPERLDGSGTPLDATSDVYALGATLYKILTGRDAFRATNRQQLLDKILKGDYLSPRDVNPGTSATLTAICAKAMSIRQRDRYQNAGALADDIQSWMDDEPVSCRKENWIDWTGRCMRRYRAATLATLLTLLAIITATSLLAVMSTRNARQRAEDLAALQQAHVRTELARESGLAALARYAAMQIERETESTWKTMEQAALNPKIPEWCSIAERDQAPCPDLQAWLEKLYTQHREDLRGSSWFVLNAQGDQLGRFPEGRLAQEGIRNFSHKSYFHGELVEYPEGTDRKPLTIPALSTVFWSSSDACRKVAYSVPIPSPEGNGPMGVLVMTVRLGDVRMLDIDVDGRIDRQAVLVDLRADWKERTGTVLQHPSFREERIDPDQAPLIDAEVVQRLQSLLPRPDMPRIVPEVRHDFMDPILKELRLAAIAPVRVRGGTTGLFVVVTEPPEAHVAAVSADR